MKLWQKSTVACLFSLALFFFFIKPEQKINSQDTTVSQGSAQESPAEKTQALSATPSKADERAAWLSANGFGTNGGHKFAVNYFDRKKNNQAGQ